MLGGLVETGDVHVAHAGTNHEMQVNAVTWNLVTYDSKLDRLLRAFAQDRDVNRGPLGAFEQVSHIAGRHVICGLAVNGDDDVTGANARTVGRSADEGGDDDNFVIARSDGHTHAVIL